MGLFSAISDWKTARYEKKVAIAKAEGKCPDCNGRGFHTIANEYMYAASYYDCPGCEGSGSYDDWAGLN
ncbi:hypothetical protein SAMN05421736_11728 [Evansella caseinilytica]|uniref:Methionine aminopeptidase n=1 Tax=Evansella caseinilytica TaxID=1503961 RepID=A0A1H3U0M2_9BACI|nr:methionine aminopeptidase [Evansella caseinilytica]SDZ55847.1 hypothetical protein SAMN05421736_11728 [Evansella caseinilytica]